MAKLSVHPGMWRDLTRGLTETGKQVVEKMIELGMMIDISHHIEYLVQVGGEDCVGIGTDFDGFATPPDDLDNASRMPRLTQRLVADGHPEPVIRKILGENVLRALRQGWGRKA